MCPSVGNVDAGEGALQPTQSGVVQWTGASCAFTIVFRAVLDTPESHQPPEAETPFLILPIAQ